MKELLIIAIGAAVVNNVVLSQFLGLCPFFGVSKKIETAAGMVMDKVKPSPMPIPSKIEATGPFLEA